MDMKRKRCKLRNNKKLLTLKATASAVLLLNSGAVSAVTCPSFITNSIPDVCTFDTGPSVTVANTGRVHGILMNAYQPADSFITVDAGGVITGSQIAIQLTGGSSLTGAIGNNGDLHGDGTGIQIAEASSVGGGIVNSGTITAGSHGIAVFSSSTVNGGIVNNGTITGAQAGILLSGNTSSSSLTRTGVSTLTGGITNNGLISGTGSGGVGIAIDAANLSGGINNTGTITGNTTNGEAIAIYSSTINGGISNAGQLNGLTGIRIDDVSTVTGNISNTGSINSNYGGILFFHTSSISGNINNAGLIAGETNAATEFGISVGTSSVVNGSISNSGTMNVTNAGIGIFNGSTVNGGITNSGTINSSDIGIVATNSSVANGITNSGTIEGSAGIGVFGTTLNGDIVNTGSIIGSTTGIAIINSTANGKISNSGTIQGLGNFAIGIEPGSGITSVDILGNHARVIGQVNTPDVPFNITDGAVFTSEGDFIVESFNIASNALFNMANPITVANGVNNSGTLGVNTLQNITGNYTQLANGTFRLGATNVTTYGQLAASGQVDLAASGAINVQVRSGASFKAGDVLKNVVEGSTLIVPINGYSVTDNSFIYQFTASTNATQGVDLTIGIDPNAYSACRGTFCANAANVIIHQIAKGNPAFGNYAALPSIEAFAIAAAQATPELTNENLQVIQLATRSVFDIVPMWSSLHGASAGDAMIYQPHKLWLKPYGGSATQNRRDTVSGYTASVWGVALGGDTLLCNDWLIGGAVAGGGENLDGRAELRGQSIHSAQYQALVYTAKWLPYNSYFAAQGLIGYGDNNSKRYIPVYGNSARGSFDSWFTNINAELGWNHAINDRFVFVPTIGASYIFINQGSYLESGSLMDLHVRSNNNSSLILDADANIAYRATHFSRGDITITGHVGVGYDVIHSQPSTIATFVAGGPNFSTYGIQYNGPVFRGGVGLSLYDPAKPYSFNMNGDVQTGNNGYNTVYSATLKYRL